MTNHVKNVLIAARQAITDPNNWTKEAIARNKIGEPLRSAVSRQAVCYCSLGALHVGVMAEVKQYPAVYDYGVYSFGQGNNKQRLAKAVAQTLLMEVTSETEFAGIDIFNDDATTSHADVMAIFDSAIAKQPD